MKSLCNYKNQHRGVYCGYSFYKGFYMKTLIQLQKSSKNGVGGFHFIDPDTRIRKLWDKRKHVCRQAIQQLWDMQKMTKKGYAKNDKKWDMQKTTKKITYKFTYV